jgi:hypothetical protein
MFSRCSVHILWENFVDFRVFLRRPPAEFRDKIAKQVATTFEILFIRRS